MLDLKPNGAPNRVKKQHVIKYCDAVEPDEAYRHCPIWTAYAESDSGSYEKFE